MFLGFYVLEIWKEEDKIFKPEERERIGENCLTFNKLIFRFKKLLTHVKK